MAGTRPAGGFVLWIELRENGSALQLHPARFGREDQHAPGPMFSATQSFQNFIRLNCGHPWSDTLERAVGMLGRLAKKLM